MDKVRCLLFWPPYVLTWLVKSASY